MTTFNQYAVISENRMTPIPKDFDLKTAPLLGCAVTTAAGVVNNDAHLKVGESVVVFGVGGVGLNVVQFAALAGGYPIVAVDLLDHKLEMARARGLTHTHQRRQEVSRCRHRDPARLLVQAGLDKMHRDDGGQIGD